MKKKLIYTLFLFLNISFSTEQNQLVIPAGSLEFGENYYATVQAQKINGDPKFKTYSYYFVSVIESSQVGFLVE